MELKLIIDKTASMNELVIDNLTVQAHHVTIDADEDNVTIGIEHKDGYDEYYVKELHLVAKEANYVRPRVEEPQPES